MNNGLSVHLVWGWGLRDRSLLGPEFFYVIFNIVDFIYHIHYDIFWVWGLDHLRPWWDLQHCQWMPLLSCPWKRKLEGIKLKNRCHFCVRKFWYPYSKQNHLSPSLTTFLYPTISLANFHSCKSTSITNINHYHPLTSLCVVSLLSHNNTTNTNANIMDRHQFDLWHIHQSVWWDASRVGSQAASVDVGQRVLAWWEEDGHHGHQAQSWDKSEAVTITVMY